MTDLNNFTTQKELFDFLLNNKSKLIAEKCYNVKKADAISTLLPAAIAETAEVVKLVKLIA